MTNARLFVQLSAMMFFDLPYDVVVSYVTFYACAGEKDGQLAAMCVSSNRLRWTYLKYSLEDSRAFMTMRNCSTAVCMSLNCFLLPLRFFAFKGMQCLLMEIRRYIMCVFTLYFHFFTNTRLHAPPFLRMNTLWPIS